MDQARLDLHQVPDLDRTVEPHATSEDGDGGTLVPLLRDQVRGLVDPLHHGAAVHLAAPVHIRRLGQEPQRPAQRGDVSSV